MTMASRPASSWRTFMTGMATMVVQFGLATMPLGIRSRASAFTSGTTRGTSGSIRQAEELSTTVAPAAATRGASSLEAGPPAENRAMSMPSKRPSAASSTVTSPSFQGSLRPLERLLAKYRISSTGKWRSASTDRITPPTCPVAPKIATRMAAILRAGRRRPPGLCPAGRRVGPAQPRGVEPVGGREPVGGMRVAAPVVGPAGQAAVLLDSGAGGEGHDVVDLAPGRRGEAVGMGAAAVPDLDRPPGGSGEQAGADRDLHPVAGGEDGPLVLGLEDPGRQHPRGGRGGPGQLQDVAE